MKRYLVIYPSEGGMATINNVFVVEAESMDEARDMAAIEEWGSLRNKSLLHVYEIDTMSKVWRWFR